MACPHSGLSCLVFAEASISDPRAPQDIVRAVVTTVLETAGHTCLVSGLTITGAFLGIMIIPQSTLRGLGLGAGVAVSFVLAVQVHYWFVVAALVLSWHSFVCCLQHDCVHPTLHSSL